MEVCPVSLTAVVCKDELSQVQFDNAFLGALFLVYKMGQNAVSDKNQLL